MRTAIFVYQTTDIHISTSENNLQLCGMGTSPVSLSTGQNALSVAPGIYKIESCQDILVTGESAAFDLTVTSNSKDNIPPLPPRRAASSLGPLDVFALQEFFAIADAKVVASP